jgi:SAM-dependent methyltransferase
MEHWSDLYYGAVYLESIRDLLTPRLSELEAGLIRTLLRIGASDRVLDAGCGHGRHAGGIAPMVKSLVGLDRNAAALRDAVSARASGGVRGAAWIRGDVRALPFADGAFDAAYSWYASLFMFDDAANLACLADLARVVRPGGRVLVHHANPLRLALEPHDTARRVLADGTVVEEESVFDAPSGVDRSARRLVRPDGSVVAATAELRYYRPAEWKDLSRAAGLRLAAITTTPWAGGAPAGELGPDAPDLIALLEKPT